MKSVNIKAEQQSDYTQYVLEKRKFLLKQDVRLWRASATMHRVNAALIKFPEIRVKILALASQYDRLASMAEVLQGRFEDVGDGDAGPIAEHSKQPPKHRSAVSMGKTPSVRAWGIPMKDNLTTMMRTVGSNWIIVRTDTAGAETYYAAGVWVRDEKSGERVIGYGNALQVRNRLPPEGGFNYEIRPVD